MGILFDTYREFFLMPVLWQWPFVAAMAGLVGSFMNVCIWRIPRGESIVFPRSHCPACKAILGVPDLVPVLSYVFLRGRCRHCGQAFSPRYMLVELFNILSWSGALFWLGLGIPFLGAAAASSVLITFLGIRTMHDPPSAPTPADEGGFTFLGVLFTMAIFAIFLPSFLGIMRTGYFGASKNRDYIIAFNLARERIEELQLLPLRHLRSDWEVYVKGERMTDNIFLDEFDPLYSKQGQDEEFFYENFTDVMTPIAKYPDTLQEKFERAYSRYFGYEYTFYPKDYRGFRRVTRVKLLEETPEGEPRLKEATVTVTIDTSFTKGRKIELKALFSSL